MRVMADAWLQSSALPHDNCDLTERCIAAVQEGPIYSFVAVVPVTMDALFKYWIFKGLNRKNPAAAVTLKNMDRH